MTESPFTNGQQEITNVVVPAGARIGFDHEADAERFTVSQHGVVAIPKNAQLD